MRPSDAVFGAAARNRFSEAVAAARRAFAQASIASITGGTISDTADIDLLTDSLHRAEFRALDLMPEWQQNSMSEAGKEFRELCDAALEIRRVLPPPSNPLETLKEKVRLASVGVLGDRSADVRRFLGKGNLSLAQEDDDWAARLFNATADAYLRIVRKNGWADLDVVAARIAELRTAQSEFEQEYLAQKNSVTQAAALELVAFYHLAKAIETLGVFVGTGQEVTAPDSIELHFSRAIKASDAAGIAELSVLLHWMRAACRAMSRATIWHQLAAYNSKMTSFKKELASRSRAVPLFELLPTQREAVQDVMNTGNRAVVVELPTSGGKTLLAEFRILQTKVNVADSWIAYIVPTRALINQVTRRLRRDLAPLDVTVEQATPALEIDVFEEELVATGDGFDVLVTTPEKLDLLIRSGGISLNDRPLGLVVLDEAHNISEGARGLRTELLLSMINRESPDTHFLLLSPFVPNASELATWLDAERSTSVRPRLTVAWAPNDRLVGLSYPSGSARKWGVRVRSLHTTKPTLELDADVPLGPFGGKSEPISKAKAKNKIAAETTRWTCERAGTIVLAYSPSDTWKIARQIASTLEEAPASELRALVQRFVRSEYGADFELAELLDKGVAVHHAGLSAETRYLLELLAEEDELRALVATTTLAQGVNFPISSVVFATHYKAKQVGAARWIKEPLRPDEFWNIAGRAGRLTQDSVGIVLLASTSREDEKLEKFVSENVRELVSSLEAMLQEIVDLGWELDLHRLVRNDTKWSSFVQFLSHAYRQIGDHQKFVAETEMLLKRTYAYHRLSVTSPDLAERLVESTQEYAERLSRMPSGVHTLVDGTGFAPETVVELLRNKADFSLSPADWSPSQLFRADGGGLASLVGTLLDVDELSIEPRGHGMTGTLSDILRLWVEGATLREIADSHFSHVEDDSARITEACRLIFQRLAHQASWGISALQRLASSEFDKLSDIEQEQVRTLPAMLYYGASTVDGVLMRTLGVPRTVAEPLGDEFKKHVAKTGATASRRQQARQWLGDADEATWSAVRSASDPLSAADYARLWKLLAN